MTAVAKQGGDRATHAKRRHRSKKSSSRRHGRPSEPGVLARLSALAPPLDTAGPHVRLGLAWFVVAMSASAAGVVFLAPLMAVTGLAAAAQAGRSRAGQDAEAIVPMCALGGAALPAMAAAGPLGVAVAALAVALACFAWEPARALAGRYSDTSRTSAARTAAIAVLVGLAAATPVLARRMGLAEGLVLVALVSLHDASAYIVGSGANKAWEGHAAGAAAIGAASLAVAAALVPPFRGASPWILGLILVLLIPPGPSVASALLGDPAARVPILRRIDSYLLAGPVWVLAARLIT